MQRRVTYSRLSWLAVLSLAACSSQPQSSKVEPVRDASSPPAIAYPAGLEQAVASCCAAFHLGRRDEVRGVWADSDGAGSVPFFVEGDFNGDGAGDAAVLLVATGAAGIELAVFEGGAQGYRLAHRRSLQRVDDLAITAPQEIVLRLVRKGEEWAPESGDVPREYPHAHAAVAFETRKADAQGMIIAYQHLLYWDGKAYSSY